MRKFILLFALLISVQITFPQSEIGISKERISRVDDYFESLVENGEVAGVITLVARNNQIGHFKSYGYSDIENKEKITKDALIPIASMTKVITSIAVLQLYEKGKISLKDPIKKHIPELANLRVIANPHQSIEDSLITEKINSKLTVMDFLRHTSGMTYSYSGTVVDKLYAESGFRKWNKSMQEFVKKVGEIPLAFQPGDRWEYSYSHDVLGYLVEKVSGKSLSEYFEEYIFRPLEMSSADFKAKEKNRFSNLYNYKNGKLVIREDKKTSRYLKYPPAFSGGGGFSDAYGCIVCSTEDFYKLSSMLLNYGSYKGNQILSRKSVELMTTNCSGKLVGKGEGYGLGVGMITSVGDYGQIGSVGEIYWAGAPYNTYFWIDYKEKTIGLMFTNTAPFGHLQMMSKFKVLTTQAIE